MPDHHRHPGLDQRPVRNEVTVLQLIEIRGGHGSRVGVTGPVSVTGEVLEHRHDPRVLQTVRVGVGVTGHHGGVVAERTVPDHLVVGFVAHIGDGRVVDGDAELFHLQALLFGQGTHLLHRHRRGQFARRRTVDTEAGQPRYAATFLIDRHHDRRLGHLLHRSHPAVGQHPEIGPTADEDATDLFPAHDVHCILGAGHPDDQQLGQLAPRRHLRQFLCTARCRLHTRRGGRRRRRSHRGRGRGVRRRGTEAAAPVAATACGEHRHADRKYRESAAGAMPSAARRRRSIGYFKPCARSGRAGPGASEHGTSVARRHGVTWVTLSAILRLTSPYGRKTPCPISPAPASKTPS